MLQSNVKLEGVYFGIFTSKQVTLPAQSYKWPKFSKSLQSFLIGRVKTYKKKGESILKPYWVMGDSFIGNQC